MRFLKILFYRIEFHLLQVNSLKRMVLWNFIKNINVTPITSDFLPIQLLGNSLFNEINEKGLCKNHNINVKSFSRGFSKTVLDEIDR